MNKLLLFLFCTIISTTIFAQNDYELQDINQGPLGSSAKGYVVGPNGDVYFSALATGNQASLWKSDGTINGTVKITNLDRMPEPGLQNPSVPMFFDGQKIYFWQDNLNEDAGNLTVTDGTANGTEKIFSLSNESSEYDFSVTRFAQTSGGVFFANDFDIYGTAGVVGSTGKVRYDAGGTSHLIAANDKLYYNNRTSSGNFLFQGSSTGTNWQQVKKIGEEGTHNILFELANKYAYTNFIGGVLGQNTYTLTVEGFPTSTDFNEIFINKVVLFNNEVVFFAKKDGIIGLYKLSTSGTSLIRAFDNDYTNRSRKYALRVVNGNIAILAERTVSQGVINLDLWTSDGTVSGTNLLKEYKSIAHNASNQFNFQPDFGKTFFFAKTTATSTLALFETDGTSAGTNKIIEIPTANNAFNFFGLHFQYSPDGYIFYTNKEPHAIDLNATGNCAITADIPFYTCQSNGTSNPNDDTYKIRLNATGEFTGASGWETTSGLTPAATGFYGNSVLIENVPAGLNTTITVADVDNSSCQTNIQLQLPGTCSDPSVGQDLSLEDLQAPSSISAGASLGFTYDLLYTGGQSIAASVGAIFSNDQVISNEDVRSGVSYFNYSFTGKHNDNVKVIQIPSNLVSGTYYLIVQVGTNSQEIDETNNTIIVPVIVDNGNLQCSITGTIGEPRCVDFLNSSDPDDDFFEYEFSAIGSGDIDSQYDLLINGVYEGTYNYNTEYTSVRRRISFGDIDVTFETKGAVLCSDLITVQPPAPCSSNGSNPTVALSTPNNIVTDPFTVNVAFSEDVTDFTLAEIQVTNGTKSNAAQQNASEYSFTVTPTNLGTVTIVVPEAVAFNNNDLGNLISNTLSVNYVTDPPSGNVDLELTASTNIDPDQYSNFSVTFTLQNKGSEATDFNTAVKVYIPTGMVLQGGNSATAPQGSFETDGDNLIWKLFSVPANSSITLTVNLFNLSDSQKSIFAEVITQSPSDVDSSPNNGTPPTPNEDDEAVIQVNGDGGGGCSINAVVSNNVCNDAGTPNNPDDDTFSYQLLVTNGGASGTWARFNSSIQLSSGTYGVPVTIDGGLISAASSNPSSYLVRDGSDATCSTTYGITAPNSCSNGGGDQADLEMANITGLPSTAKQGDLVNFNFDLINSGEVIASGDYTISIILSTDANVGNSDDVEVGVINTGNTAVGTISGVLAAITIPSNQPVGAYSLILIADANNDIAESNESNNFLSGSIQIQQSGGGGDGVDLELNATLSNNTPAQWSFFSSTFVVTNTGTTNATGVKVTIPTPDGIVLKGGDEYTTSQGSFQVFGSNEWNIGSINAGSSATITLNYFNRSSAAQTIFGQVSAQNETDVDSTPNNNNGSTANEDDEAGVTINTSSAAARQGIYETSDQFKNKDYQILNTYPTISNNEITIAINSKKEAQLLMKVYNMKGQEVSQQQVNITIGANRINVNILELSSGMHHVMIFTNKGIPLTTRFIKQRL